LTAKDPAATATVLPTRGKIHHVAISPDSRWLVTGSRDGHTGHLWDLAANAPGEAPIALEHDQGITSVAYTPDNQRLATGTSGGTLRLWDLTARFPASALVALPAHKGAVRALAVSPDNRYLVSGGDDKTVRVWNLQLKELMDQARRVAGRALSEEERRTYMLSEPVEQGKAER
jgi:WD40 repeat protein